jgi:heat shock protein HslJ
MKTIIRKFSPRIGFFGVISLLTCAPALPAGADDTEPAQAPAADKSELESLIKSLVGTEWLLEDIGGKGVIDDARATLVFREGMKLGGRGTVNRFGAPIRIENGKPVIGPMVSTRMAGAPALMDQEQKYLKALERATAIKLDEPFLYIHVQGEEKPLRFVRLKDGE